MNTHFAVAVHALALLQHEGGTVSAVYMAGSIGTNPVFLRRVLRDLQKAGLIEIKRGASGGAELARPAAVISLADVYDAVHASDELFSMHQGSSPACTVGRGVQGALEGVIADADETLRSHLGTRSVADVLEMVLSNE